MKAAVWKALVIAGAFLAILIEAISNLAGGSLNFYAEPLLKGLLCS